MKNLIICLLVLFLAGCGKSDEQQVLLRIPTGTDYRVDENDQVLKIAVECNLKWSVAVVSDNWCSADKTGGTGNAEISLKIIRNTLSKDRIATVKVSSGTTEAIIKVTQTASTKITIHQLPVIFHVFYNYASDPVQNIPTGWLQTKLAECNDYYRNKSVDMLLNFVPATHDPSGRALTEQGVERIKWGLSAVDVNAFMDEEENVKYLWNPNEYINVMIFPFTKNSTLGISYLAYTLKSDPVAGLENGDYYLENPVSYPHCVCINSKYAQTKHDILNVSEVTITLSHELGHYLGLYHVFADPQTSTDYCEDTPSYIRAEYEDWLSDLPQSELTFKNVTQRKATNGVTFTSTNIMDYDYSYLDEFSANQMERVRHVLGNSPLIPRPKTAAKRTPSGEVYPIPDAIKME